MVNFSPWGLLHIKNPDLETAGSGCGEVLCEPPPLHLNHLYITAARLITQKDENDGETSRSLMHLHHVSISHVALC